ncbi:hypothetical protein [Leifsonia sp. NCR5]|uniref:hypothetical protein n=1 Tax=Leifsonia sp. NCR5 TaxID=1978342 RepID=UPI0015C46811|nr:hypothetical protein [Leifsonia sp. NCR5]
MRVRVRIEDRASHELGEEIIEQGAEYEMLKAAALAKVPDGFVANAILIDREAG